MSTQRKIVFRNGYIYHVCNRGIERKSVFVIKRDYERMVNLINFYKHKKTPIRFSRLMIQPINIRAQMLADLYNSEKNVEILCYCLMPNHFHLLLKQINNHGIAKFASNITNAYTKYFNTKNQRVGPLFQGTFKAVLVESDAQLVHLSRYIHLNPATSSIIETEDLENYIYSSYPEYLSATDGFISKKIVLGMFKNVEEYRKFVINQADYAKELDKIKHLTLD